ncbi:MAG: carbohydrate ABC transporter permease [bacterium]
MKIKGLDWRKQKLIYPYIFISPFFILFATFSIWPIIYSFYISLNKKMGLGPSTFIGIKNYVDLARDAVFWQTAFNTFYYVIGTTCTQIPLALILALIAHSAALKVRNFFRVSFFLPVITSGVVISIIFSIVLDHRYGILNNLLERVGITPVAWLEDANVVMVSIIIVGIWRYAGLNMLYFLAGLQSIPEELYEAARVDGAGRLQSFWYITLPLLKQVGVFVLVMHMIGAFQLFDVPYLLTGGGPGNASTSIAMYLYRNAFSFFRFGYGSAVAYSLFLIIMIVSLVQLRLTGTLRRGE